MSDKLSFMTLRPRLPPSPPDFYALPDEEDEPGYPSVSLVVAVCDENSHLFCTPLYIELCSKTACGGSGVYRKIT
jgi:hypothetical protein